ncbi:unnamed protein product, partial [Amoebophrya sp. A25]
VVLLVAFSTQDALGAVKIQSWHLSGPWPVGKNELDADPSFELANGGVFELWNNRRTTNATATSRSNPSTPTTPSRGASAAFFSELVTGGQLAGSFSKEQLFDPSFIQGKNIGQKPPSKQNFNDVWATVNPTRRVEWSQLVQQLSAMEVLEFQAWAVATVDFSKTMSKGKASNDIKVYAVGCEGVRQFFIDDDAQIFTGDMFRTGAIKGVFSPTKTKHTLFVPLKAKGPATEFKCGFEPLPSIGSGTFANRPASSLEGDVVHAEIAAKA